MPAIIPNTKALAMDDHKSHGWASVVKPERNAPADTCWTTTLKKYPPPRPATLTSETRSAPTVAEAHNRGVTRRCTGLMPITCRASISSRILREPISAVIAAPPAPAIMSAAATGDASRTMASTMAEPVAAVAPSCLLNEPTWRAITAPNGMEIRMLGMLVTLAMNQHWSMYSRHHVL